jgi:putative ABC transport system permease protein
VSTAIYSAVRTLFWTPLGIAQPERVAVWTAAGRVDGSVSWPDFVDVRSQQSTFSSVGAARPLYAAVKIGDIVETVFGESVSGDYFATLGVTARLGRVLQPHDESSGARVAVVSDAFWRTRLHGDPAILGRSITIAGQPFEIVGVIRGPFHGVPVILPGAVWIPDSAVSGSGWHRMAETPTYGSGARHADRVGTAEAGSLDRAGGRGRLRDRAAGRRGVPNQVSV